MNTRLLGTALLGVLALSSFSTHSFGGSPPPPPTCYPFAYSSSGPRPRSLAYDVNQGVTVSFGSAQSPYTVTAQLPLMVGSDPNPHFDRLYALLMKGFDSQRIGNICVDHAPANYSDVVQLVSVQLDFVETNRVAVCDGFDPSSCASVYSGELSTSK